MAIKASSAHDLNAFFGTDIGSNSATIATTIALSMSSTRFPVTMAIITNRIFLRRRSLGKPAPLGPLMSENVRRLTKKSETVYKPSFVEKLKMRKLVNEPAPEIRAPELYGQWVTLTFDLDICSLVRRGNQDFALLHHIKRLIKKNQNCRVTNRNLTGYRRLSIKVSGFNIPGEYARLAALNIVREWIKRYRWCGLYFPRGLIFPRSHPSRHAVLHQR